MNEIAQLFAIISIASGLVGASLFVRARVADHDRRLAAHDEFNDKIIDRLGRIETKIDALMEHK